MVFIAVVYLSCVVTLAASMTVPQAFQKKAHAVF